MKSGEKNVLYLGCVADDFTGASDAASFLVKEGIKTYLFNGVPDDDIELDCNAVVIALKTRTINTDDAVDQSLKAFEWLADMGALQFYYKYCSTFDSTPKGNIGPVIDAVMEKYKINYTVLCPSLLANERIVKDGNLYVKGVPLDQSPMRNHPLTPMWSPKISELMKEQGKYECIQITSQELNGNKSQLQAKINNSEKPVYFVPDFYEQQHGDKIVNLFGESKLLTGGSGLMTSLGKFYAEEGNIIVSNNVKSDTKGRGIILVGSCSTATLEQIAYYRSMGKECYKIDPLKVLSGEQNTENIWEQLTKYSKDDILVYSSDKIENVIMAQKQGKEKVAEKLEALMAGLAVKAVESGYKRLVIGGGETSGAVTKALGYAMYQVGESIAPGVPLLVPLNHSEVRLVLKSGNFGQEDFFERAMRMITSI